MDVADLTPVSGGFVLRIRRSKTDQAGQGMDVPVLGTAGDALADWLKASRIRDGRLFRGVTASGAITKSITGRQIARIVKSRLESAGYDPTEYGAHSLRSGFITESGRQGVSIGETLSLSGHRGLDMFLTYYRGGNVVQNPAGRLLERSGRGRAKSASARRS
jgi:integrase